MWYALVTIGQRCGGSTSKQQRAASNGQAAISGDMVIRVLWRSALWRMLYYNSGWLFGGYTTIRSCMQMLWSSKCGSVDMHTPIYSDDYWRGEISFKGELGKVLDQLLNRIVFGVSTRPVPVRPLGRNRVLLAVFAGQGLEGGVHHIVQGQHHQLGSMISDFEFKLFLQMLRQSEQLFVVAAGPLLISEA